MWRYTVWLIAFIGFSVVLYAQELPIVDPDEPQTIEESEAEGPASEHEYKLLLNGLDANKFAIRRAASQKLEALGFKGIQLAHELALSDSREATTRSLAALSYYASSKSEALSDEAGEALESLVENEDFIYRSQTSDRYDQYALIRHQRSYDKLWALGARFFKHEAPAWAGNGELAPVTNYWVEVGSAWEGTAADFALFDDIFGIERFRIEGVPIGDEILPHLAKLKSAYLILGSL